MSVSRVRYVEPLVMLATLARWFFLATATGAVVGSGTSLFLSGLFAASARTEHIPLWLQVTLLPLGGILNGLILYYGYRNATGAGDSVIAAVHRRSGEMPVKTFLLKPVTAIITLASGGSAGKEGPCSHIGGSLASWLGELIRLSPEMRRRLVACGVSAGFASVFGTPIAGAIYGIEVLTVGKLRHDLLFPALIAGVTSFEISKLWGLSYTSYAMHVPLPFSEILFVKVLLIGIACGLAAWLFIELFERLRALFRALQRATGLWPPAMPLIGGLLLAGLILVLPTDYLGLSLPLMDRALSGESVPLLAFFWKALFVAITLGSGFYGGIVTPQFVIGAVAGNAAAVLLGVDPVLGAAVGMAAVVAAASNTPIAAVFLGFELFGSASGVYVVCACITAYVVVGHRSVYPDQLLAYPKSLWMRLQPEISLEQERAGLAYDLLRKLGYLRHPARHWRRRLHRSRR